MLASKFCVVVNKCPMFNREQMPNIQLKFASSRLLCSLRCYNSRFMLCSPVFNREQMSNIQARIRLFKASPQLALLQFSLYVVQPNVHLKSRMQACRFASSIVFFCSLKKSLTEYYFCQGRIILTIRGATLNSR